MSVTTNPGTTAHGPLIESMRAAHADQVLAVYQLAIDEGQATFETTAPTWAQFDASKLPDHRHVALGSLDPPARRGRWLFDA
ncbi:hypothetical protein AB0K16_18375 [Nonomuraea jabiensis]|uniref:hypothetical protein n=1 Tax=Nonomuraea jabiensis TaxID=882448 RepID=UPI003447CA4A